MSNMQNMIQTMFFFFSEILDTNYNFINIISPSFAIYIYKTRSNKSPHQEKLIYFKNGQCKNNSGAFFVASPSDMLRHSPYVFQK